MSKEEILKIQTCVLKVNIHCDGCKDKVRKILQKTDGVYKTSIDSEQGKVTVSGNVNSDTLIRKLGKNGKHAELWGGSKCNYQNQLNNQFQNFQIDHSGKNGNNKNNKGGNYEQSGGGGGLGQMKGFQDLKLPQFKGLKLPFGGGKQKAVKFKLAEEDGMSVDYDNEFDGDDEFDEMNDSSHHNANKMETFMGNGGGKQMSNMMMNDMNSQAKGGGGNGGNNGVNGKNGGGGEHLPVLVNESGGKKVRSGGGNVNNQNQGGSGKNGGKNVGGQQSGGKGNNNCGGAQSKNSKNSPGSGSAPSVTNGNGGKKGVCFNDGIPGMPNMMNGYPGIGGASMGQMGNNMSMGQMGNYPIGHMGQMPAVQGEPTPGINGGGYFNGGVEILAGNSYPHQEHQQHLAAMMMNQQRANGNERFQPMMYARPAPAVNYMPTYPYPYPYPHQSDPYTHVFSDENTSSCNVM